MSSQTLPLNQPLRQLSDTLRRVVLTELLFPITLLILGIYHGLLQVLYRAGFIRASSFLGLEYYQGLTLHGTINAVVLTTFFAVAFGNVVVSYFLGKKLSDVAARFSLTLMLGGTLAAAWAMLAGKATVLYTFYPPLKAHPAFYLGVASLIVGSWIAFFSWIPAYRSWRTENPGKKTPLAVVGIFSTFIVWFIATLPAAYEVLVLLLPWSLGWTPTVNVVLARTLFWFFGHPLVYFWLLPAYTMYYAMLPKLAGGRLYSDFAGRFAFMMFVVLSAPIGFHHQYSDPGIRTAWKALHGVLTFGVAIPSMLTAFTLAASMENGARERGGKGLFAWWGKLPYFSANDWLFSYLFCGLILFIFGGITGIVNASYQMNLVVHNTSWMPAHFHMTVAGPVFLALIGMTLMLVSQLTGKPLGSPGLRLSVPYLWMIGILIMSSGLFLGGVRGEPRRTNLGLTYTNHESPLFRHEWISSTTMAAVGGTVMTIAMLFYFIVFFRMIFSKRTVEKPELYFPTSEPIHDEKVPVLENFRPFLVGAVVMVILAYVPPLVDIARGKVPGSVPFQPDSPIPVQTSANR